MSSLVTIDGRPALRFERAYEHAIDRVWRAVTEPAELARWFVVPVPWIPELGETFSAAGQSGAITELEAPRVLAWTWGEERYRFDLRGDDERSLLVFIHVFDPRLGPPAMYATGWEVYLDRLHAHLDGGFLSEEDAHHPRRLTLEDGPALRLERVYPYAIERVWRALSDPEEQRHWFPTGEPMEVTESNPPHLLAGTWFGDPLRFELTGDDEGCVLVFTHAFADHDTAARTAAGWDRCFARVDSLLHGEPLSEAASLEGWPQVHEGYAERFGVDPELGRRAFAEHPLT